MPVRDLIDHMITRSSNLATNALIELVGADRANATAHTLGATNIRVLRGVEDTPAFRAGMNNTTTARDLEILLEAIQTGRAASAASCDAMRNVLLRQEFNTEIPAGLPPGTKVAHKTGFITGVLHDAAIVYPASHSPYVLVVLTRDIPDQAVARRLISRHLATGLRLRDLNVQRISFMIVAMGTDHGGFTLKTSIVDAIRRRGSRSPRLRRVRAAARRRLPRFRGSRREGGRCEGARRAGVLICGSGVGASIAANKFVGIRSALCHDTFSAHQGVEDDSMNVIALGARVVGPSLAAEIVTTFLRAEFSGAERHKRRLEKVNGFDTKRT